MGMTITAGIISFGDEYWPRFADRLFASFERCDPKPDEVIVVSDQMRQVPPYVQLVVVPPGRNFMMYNDLAQHSNCDYVFSIGLDDECTTDSFVPVDTDADAIIYPAQQVGEASWVAMTNNAGAIVDAWKAPNNPVNGGVIWKTSTLREMPIRDYIYADEVLWAEWSYFGRTKLHIDDRVRILWHRWRGSTSWPANTAGEHQAQDFKRKLREGLIQKGIPE